MGKKGGLRWGEQGKTGSCYFFLFLITSSLSDMGDLEGNWDPSPGGGDLALTGGT